MIEKLKDRYYVIIIFLVLAFAVILFQLAELQIIRGKEYDEKSQQRLLNERKIIAPRGNIKDRYGIPIATNDQGFIVQIVKSKLTVDELNGMLLKLVSIFEKNNEIYYKSFNKYITYNGSIVFGTGLSQATEKIDNWKTALKMEFLIKPEDINQLKSPKDIFDFLKNNVFHISEKYTTEEAWKIASMRYETRSCDAMNPLCLARNVSKETTAEIEEKHDEFPGVTTDIIPIRKYNDALTIAHVIGYMGIISPTELSNRKDEGYRMNDLIGKSGIELSAEEYMRGTNGQRSVEFDVLGKFTKELDEVSAIPGNDVILTLDMKIQKVAMESLERNIMAIRQRGDRSNKGDADAGAVVAIDVNSGEVLAMASYPSYDLSIFLAGADNKEAQAAIAALSDPNNKSTSEFNRAISGIYTPGSTFKPIVAIAGLEEGVITPNTVIVDRGVTNIGGMVFKCLEYKNGQGAHGALTLVRALATSCNVFFHELGYRVTIDKIDKWAGYFGLGEKTGIDIQGESKGILSSIEYKKKVFNDIWRPADTAQSAIGQLYNSFTPLQLASYVSSIANSGKQYKPYLIKKVLRTDGSIVVETVPEYKQIPVKPETIKAVQAGMVAVTNMVDGTAVGAFRDFPFKVAGKTGTAETGKESKYSSNALFVCYAPADNPKIAVAVVIEHGVWGAYTAPVARDILEAYFNMNNTTGQDDKIELDITELTH